MIKDISMKNTHERFLPINTNLLGKCCTPIEKSNFCPPPPISMLNEFKRGSPHADLGKEWFAKPNNIEMREGGSISEKRRLSEGYNTFVRNCSINNQLALSIIRA